MSQCGVAGRSLVGAVTGGLAALLALFTVTDATLRGQAVTTALLPLVGFPVLAAAAELHDHPVARDLTFLADHRLTRGPFDGGLPRPHGWAGWQAETDSDALGQGDGQARSEGCIG